MPSMVDYPRFVPGKLFNEIKVAAVLAVGQMSAYADKIGGWCKKTNAGA